MHRSRFTQEQIVGVLQEHEAGAATAARCRQHGISEQTFYRWKQKYGSLDALYRLHDAAVHYKEEPREPMPHPLGVHVASEQVRYSLETVEQSLDLLIEVLVTCFTNAKRGKVELANYLDGMRHVLTELVAQHDAMRTRKVEVDPNEDPS